MQEIFCFQDLIFSYLNLEVIFKLYIFSIIKKFYHYKAKSQQNEDDHKFKMHISTLPCGLVILIRSRYVLVLKSFSNSRAKSKN